MTKDDIIRMAREAGFTNPEKFTTTDANLQGILSDFWENLDRFAALVIKPWAAQLKVERKRFQELNDVVALGMQHARADEREACAKVCDEMEEKAEGTECCKWPTPADCAYAIRARGTGPTSVIYSPGELAARGLTHEDVVKLIKENT